MENPSTVPHAPPSENAAADIAAVPPPENAAPPAAAPAAPSDPRLNSTTKAIPARVEGTPGPAVGLPEGVTVPVGIDRSLLQGKLLDTLNRLPVQLINEALNEYDDAVKNKEGQIRNHGAYLYGVIKRYTSVQERALKGEGTGGMPMGPELTPAVNDRLRKLVDTGFCTEEEMNDKIKSKIRMLAEKDAIFAIDELSSVERGQIRNFGSYFMGILNRYMRGERDPSKGFSKQRSSNSYGSRDDRRYGDRGDRDYRRRDSPPRGRSYPEDRYGYGGSRDQDSHYRRDRSRDRYDDDRRSDMGRSDYRRNTTTNDHQHHRDSFRSQRYDDPRNQPASLPMGQQQHQGAYSTTTVAVPPPPPPRGTAQPPSQFAGYNPQQPPQFMQQQSQPQQQQQGFHQVQPPQQQQYVPQTINQQTAVPGAYASSSAPAGVPGGYVSSASSGAPGSYPLSSAPTGMLPSVPTNQNMQGRYASSVPPAGLSAATGAPASSMFNPTQHNIVQSNNHVQQPVAGNQMTMQQQNQPPQNYLGSPSAAPQSTNWQSQGQQIPPDILGLADRAASAVQALASQNAMNAPAPAQTLPPPGPTSGFQTNHYMNSVSSQQPPPQPSQPRGPRKTATLAELPMLVQFAVKNLQATGHVDGELDGGILAMIKELPEQSALAALERFSSIDTATMRNKTAYLAGILRRDLEKVKRY